MNKSKFDLVREHVKQQRHDEYILTEQKLIDRINEVFIDREAEILNWFADGSLSDRTSILFKEYELYEIIFGEENVPIELYNIGSSNIFEVLRTRFKSLGLVLSHREDSIYNKTCIIRTEKCVRNIKKQVIGLVIFTLIFVIILYLAIKFNL